MYYTRYCNSSNLPYIAGEICKVGESFVIHHPSNNDALDISILVAIHL